MITQNRKLYIILFLIFISISSLSYGQLLLIDSIKLSTENYKSNFKQINDIVQKNYSHIRTKRINIDSLYSAIDLKISKVHTEKEYFKLLLFYFSELKNSHTTIFLGEYGLNCSVRMIENRIFLDNVKDEFFIESEIKVHDELIEIDNTPVLDWLRNESHYVSSSTSAHDLEKTLWKVFNYEFSVPRTYKVKTVNGIKNIKTNLNKPVDYNLLFPKEAKAIGKILNDSTGYIMISAMTGNVVKEFSQVFDLLHRLPNLIIDIRDNGGGNSNYSEQIARFLIARPQKACVSRNRITPFPNNYKGNLYVLLGVKTGSAAESFAIDLLESGRATLIGEPTVGDTGNIPKKFTTEFGISFRIPTRKPPQVSFKKFPMEGIGITPHYEVKQSMDDYFNEIDTVLDFTLNYIKKNAG